MVAVKNKNKSNEIVMRLKQLTKVYDINEITNENNFHLLRSFLKTSQL